MSCSIKTLLGGIIWNASKSLFQNLKYHPLKIWFQNLMFPHPKTNIIKGAFYILRPTFKGRFKHFCEFFF